MAKKRGTSLMDVLLDEIGFLYGRQALGKGFLKKAWMWYILEPVVCTVMLPKKELSTSNFFEEHVNSERSE